MKRVAAASLVLSIIALVSACATGVPGSGSGTGLVAPSEGVGESAELDAAWLDDGRMIGLVTWGSSTCVPTVDGVSAEGQIVRVALIDAEADACTADMAARVTLITTPESLDVGKDVTIAVSGAIESSDELEGDAALAGPGGMTDNLPSAGWADDLIVILSWGSSTCVPVLEKIEATGAAELTATFAEVPDDQVCTMDIGPRALVSDAPELEEDDDAFLVMLGDEFDNVRVPILGER
ncbi:hypothetical protein [Microbacterium terricola]|uniref:Uncharacterized protein n=1 Tax=Microbacterium terricola TaxID=344163 RepID=A0ABM8DV56_9MICO|nr:hypothetical protein [Microbacterium terricola]UYK39698.1 hypothetical protein OAU46_13500 [Microbacterium terricola]BDV29558.1 hypothetical protein Microterr_02180 [Microbacterium terricola]